MNELDLFLKTETPFGASYANGVTDEVRNEKERATYGKCKL
jgi:hypothetical protein